MAMALEGIRVIETGGWMVAPLCARHLGDMGAEIIKVEHPVMGDPTRGITLLREKYTGGFQEVVEICNRNKKSIGIDLYNPLGKEIIYKLIETADVFITNFQDKTAKKMGMDYESVSKINPKIVYAIGTGWGRKGAGKDRPGFDLAAYAMTGTMAQMSWEGVPPTPLGVVGMGDEINSLVLALGVMTALVHRERTGEGQLVHTSLLGSWIEVGGAMLQQALYRGVDIPRQKREAATSPLWNNYKTQDGRYIQLAMIQSDPYWHDLCQALDLVEIEKDPKFDHHWGRVENNVELISIFDKAFAKRSFAEWQERFTHYTIIWAPVLTYAEVIKDQQLRDNDYVVKVDHPIYGAIETPGIPVQLSKTPGMIRSLSPEMGQHTEEILQDIGYTWEDIARFKESKAIN
jgi:crotonobetainyl-CoA:carnitine CoA-transferase CaiB-like acyl-CoA transferase